MAADPILEDLMSQLGDVGRYQLRQILLFSLASFLAGIHMLSLTAVAPTPPHRCYIRDIDSGGTPPTFNTSVLENYLPYNADGTHDSCRRYVENTTATLVCERYVYDTTYYKSSWVMDWDLVCDKRWQRAVLQSIYMLGVVVGVITCGFLADKLGRKIVFYISGILQLIFGVTSAFMPYYWLLCPSVFIYGMFGSGGAFVTGFVLAMELVSTRKRTMCGLFMSVVFACGVMLDAFWAAIIHQHWVLQLILALHSLLLIGHWWLIDESVRWLWGQGRIQEALTIVEKGVKQNKRTFENRYAGLVVVPNNIDKPSKKNESYGVSDLFKTPALRCRMFNVGFCWFANSLVYYGLSLNTGDLVGNPFLMLFLIGLAELPGYVLAGLLLDVSGRRSVCSVLMLIGGLACVAIAFLPRGHVSVTILVMIGKCAISGSFGIIYNYTTELFPTVVRNSSMGLASMCARISGSLTPLITLLSAISMEIPTLIFGVVALTSGFLTLILPETMNKDLPQTLEDGENFGRGDNAFKTFLKFLRKK